MKDLRRAIGFLGHYRRLTIYAYVAMLISLVAQLMVPQLIQNILDAVTRGVALPTVQCCLPGHPSRDAQAVRSDDSTNGGDWGSAQTALYWAIGFILIFAVARGVFSFAQTYMSESASQGVAFDFRNQLFFEIQRLSFSYHDRNRTGQLMIRATDNVEKVRAFIGQGLLMAVQAILLLVARSSCWR